VAKRDWYQNTLSANTVFSGTDIEVIAYRNYSLYGTNNTSKQIAALRERAEDLNLQYESTVEIYSGGPTFNTGEPGTSVFQGPTPLEDKDGIAQNQPKSSQSKTERQKADFAAEVQTIQRELKKVNDQINTLVTQSSIKLGSLHTMSYSSFREKYAVRTIGRVQAKGYTQGPRTIAGTLVFNQLQEHELLRLGRIVEDSADSKPSHPEAFMVDQIAPFNLLLFFANEFGVYSSMHLFDVTIASEGQEMSVDQIVTQNAMNFYANEMIPMKQQGNQFTSEIQMLADVIAKTNKDQGISSDNGNAPQAPDQLFKGGINLEKEKNEIENMLKKTRGLF
jgi:hypothetical protein